MMLLLLLRVGWLFIATVDGLPSLILGRILVLHWGLLLLLLLLHRIWLSSLSLQGLFRMGLVAASSHRGRGNDHVLRGRGVVAGISAWNHHRRRRRCRTVATRLLLLLEGLRGIGHHLWRLLLLLIMVLLLLLLLLIRCVLLLLLRRLRRLLLLLIVGCGASLFLRVELTGLHKHVAIRGRDERVIGQGQNVRRARSRD